MLNMKIGTRFAYITPDKLFTGETAMEVKDINNQNNPLAIFKKNSGAVSALDFSSLIAGKKQDFGSASVGLDLDRAPSVSEKSFASKAASSVRPENSASDAVNVKPRKENKRKERTPAEEQAAPVPAENRPVPERAEAPAAPVESRSVAEGAARLLPIRCPLRRMHRLFRLPKASLGARPPRFLNRMRRFRLCRQMSRVWAI